MPEEISLKEYLSLRPRDLKRPEYRHLWLLLYWPIEISLFFLTEHLPREAHPIFCELDARIPFWEAMVVPYSLWFVCLAFFVIYTLLRDVPVFRRFMWYMIATVLVSFTVYLVYPNYFPGQPDPVPRRNIFSWMVQVIYKADEPTNAFPSEHVIVALGMAVAALRSKKLRRPAFSVPFVALQLLICVSVVFVKQHSVLDVAGGLAVAIPGFLLFFPRERCPHPKSPESLEL